MKEAEHTNWKATFDIRKRPINPKRILSFFIQFFKIKKILFNN